MDRMFVDRRIAFFLALLFPIQESSDRRDNCALICARLQGRRSATNGNGQDDGFIPERSAMDGNGLQKTPMQIIRLEPEANHPAER